MNRDVQKGLLSVIVPVYNAELNIKMCIDSLRSQEYQNIEILAVNNGSVDASYELLQQYAKEDNRVKAYNMDGKGVSAARNYGMARASGEFVTFVDADDWVDSKTYASIIERMEKTQSDIAIYAFSRDYKAEQELDLLPFDNETVLDNVGIREALIPRMVAAKRNSPSISGSVCRSVFRADVIADVAFDETVHIQEDLLFCIESYFKAEKILILNDVYYHYVKHEVTTTELFRPGYYNESLHFEGQIVKALENIGLFNSVKDRYWSKRIGMYSLCVSNLFRMDAPADYHVELQRIVDAFRKDHYIKGRFHPEYLDNRKILIYGLLRTSNAWLVAQVYSKKELRRQRKLSL